MLKKLVTVFLLSIGALLGFSGQTYAEEVTTSANGSDSVNQTVVNVNRQSSVNQSNTSQINSSVDINANTGGNSASDNTNGDTAVNSGNVVTNTEITNNNINQNVANPNCCDSASNSAEIEISNNGSNSVNSVSVNKQSDLTVNSNNNSTIQNNININSSTGGNEASGNGGKVTITTGNIKIDNKIFNKNINQSFVDPKKATGGISGAINGNGTDSQNEIVITIDERIILAQVNQAVIKNNVNVTAETGNNEANKNLGGVTITTGDIDIITKIVNKDINKNVVDLDKEKPEEPTNGEETPPSTTPPTTVEPGRGGSSPSSSSGGDSGSSGVGGQVLGASTGDVLPATGANWFLLATIANVLTFLFGYYLRKRAGRSPSL